MPARLALLAILGLAAALAQVNSPEKETRHRFDLAATRAAANFRAAGTIEARLNSDGSTLHPQLAALRFRIAAALDEARADMDHGSYDDADQAIQRAGALLDKFAQKIGGD